MKRKLFITILCLSFVLAFFYLQFSRKPTVDTVVTNADSSGYVATLTITANKLFIADQNKLQQVLIKHILNNDFENMMFSYDIMGYANEYSVTVHTNSWTKKLGVSAFTFRYVPGI